MFNRGDSYELPFDATGPRRPPLWWVPRRVRPVVGWFVMAPRLVQVALALIAAGAVSGAAYYFAVYKPEHERRAAASDGWRAFERATAEGDEAAMRAALDDVIRNTRPADPLAVSRKKTLDTLEADPADANMPLLTLRMALVKGDMKAADREAAKRLTVEPAEWIALCVRAQCALDRGDTAAAEKFLDALPPPDDPKARLDPAGLMYALQLLRLTGRDTGPLISFVRLRMLPFLKSPGARQVPPGVKAQLLECFLEAFETAPGKAQPAGLSESWTAVSQLFDSAAADATASGSTGTLVNLGRLVPRLTSALAVLHRDRQVTTEQYDILRGEMADRGKRVWEAVRDKDAKNPEAYRGLALLRWQSGDYRGARELVVAGMAACGDDPPLAAMFATMLQAEDRPEAAASALWQTAEKHPEQVVWWVLAAESANAARRRDRAIEACERGLKSEPGNPWLVRMEGRLWLEAGDPNKAAQVLKSLQARQPKALTSDAAAARLYSRALVESGLEVLVEDYLAEVEKAAKDANDPAAVAAALRGLIDARPAAPDAALAEQAADRADRLLARWRDDPELLRVRAAALARAAEFGAPPWDTARTKKAAAALERLVARYPDDRDAVTALAWLRLRGERKPDQALRDAAPLARAEPVQPLPANQLEVLGAVYAAANKPADAVRVLERARRAGSTARGLTLLARAYLSAGRPADAKTALKAAGNLPRTDAEQAEYLEVARALEQEKS